MMEGSVASPMDSTSKRSSAGLLVMILLRLMLERVLIA
jgi:hypothetical protein